MLMLSRFFTLYDQSEIYTVGQETAPLAFMFAIYSHPSVSLSFVTFVLPILLVLWLSVTFR